jgi:hypothetical protein
MSATVPYSGAWRVPGFRGFRFARTAHAHRSAAATDLASALDALHFHFESTEMARFVRGNASQIEIAAGLALAELRAMVEQIATGSMSIPSAPPPEATVVAELPTATEPTQVILMIRSAKFRQNGRMRFLPQYEDSPPLPVGIAQRHFASVVPCRSPMISAALIWCTFQRHRSQG